MAKAPVFSASDGATVPQPVFTYPPRPRRIRRLVIMPLIPTFMAGTCRAMGNPGGN